MQLDTNRIIGLFAPQFYGKTHLMNWLIDKIPKNVMIFVYDVNFERLTSYTERENLKFIIAKNKADQDTPEFLDTAIRHLRANYSNFFLVIEDLDKVIGKIHGRIDDSEICKLASDSRHQRIGLMYASKMPTNLPVILRADTNLFFIGQFIEPVYVNTIAQMVDRDTLVSLKPHQFIMLDRYTNATAVVLLDANTLKVCETAEAAQAETKKKVIGPDDLLKSDKNANVDIEKRTEKAQERGDGSDRGAAADSGPAGHKRRKRKGKRGKSRRNAEKSNGKGSAGKK